MEQKSPKNGFVNGKNHDEKNETKKRKTPEQQIDFKLKKRLRIKNQLAKDRENLPIFFAKKKLLEEIRKSKVSIVVGETGSGKTTQIPQYLLSEGYARRGVIGITQPRRVAAMTIAQRVCDEMGVELGEEVGYCIRFDDRTSSRTKIKYLTDGMLLREAMLDPLLKKYSVIVLDEAHERTLDTDILFGVVKNIISNREDVKVIIMSATLEAETFSKYFNAEILYVQGRQFPVDVFYSVEPQVDYLDAALIATLQVHLEEPAGDILLFLTGREEIESMEHLLEEKAQAFPPETMKLLICPIFAAMPPEEQVKVFEKTPEGCRKVVLATNIAETSITINGIKYVIDTGLVKSRIYNPKVGIESLMVVPISKAAARQRCGRAGRESSGFCYRLYTEEDFLKLSESTIPEIKRCNLANVILQLKALGIDRVDKFDYLDRPPVDLLKKALETLFALGALTNEGHLSPLGKQMAELPLEPAYSKALINSKEYKCSEEILTIISMLSIESVFFVPRGKKKEAKQAHRKFFSQEGDHIMLLNVFKSYAASGYSHAWCRDNFINARSLAQSKNIRDQLKGYCEQMKIPLLSCGEETEHVRKCFTSAFFMNAAIQQGDGSYKTLADSKIVTIHPSSVMFNTKPPCVLYNELVLTKKQYIRELMLIDYQWLIELAPHFYTKAKK